MAKKHWIMNVALFLGLVGGIQHVLEVVPKWDLLGWLGDALGMSWVKPTLQLLAGVSLVWICGEKLFD